MNRLTIIGNICKDPELRSTPKGIEVCTFTVAVNRKKGETEQTDFFRVTTWDKTAANCNKYLAKGRKVAVIGSVSVSAYTGKDGKANASLEVNASEVEFLSSRDPVDNAEIKEKGFVKVDDPDLPF
jgi:single-strand DNA-binding protein